MMTSAPSKWEILEGSAGAAHVPECPTFGSVVSLVVDSGLQFLDFDLSPGAVEAAFGRFAEDPDVLGGSAQPLLCEVLLEDGVAIHPLTRQPVDPASTYRVNGLACLRALAGKWVPLPFLRAVGRHPGGETRYDDGPMNWVRGYVAERTGRDGSPNFRLVVAVDTKVENEARSPDLVYNTPCRDDVRFQSAFTLVSRADDVAWLLGEEWLEAWLREVATGAPVTDATGASQPTSRFALAHIALYLVFLRLLKSAASMPDIRFLDTVSPRTRVAPDDIDLVIDLGHRQTLAIVAEVDPRDGMIDPAGSRLLARRDLSRPEFVYDGVFPSRVEFHRVSFGNDALSRRTGRADAFEWPSVVRVGDEALRLAELSVGLGDPTGYSDLRQGLLDMEPVERPWRFSAPVAGGVRGAMVSGSILRNLTETGDPHPAGGRARQTVLRPRFSRSSLTSLFFSEIILHAISAINSPSYSGRTAAGAVPRRLRRIVIAASFGSSQDEQRQLLARATAAVDLAYTSLGASTGMVTGARPTVVLGIDAAVASQLVVLVDQVQHKLRRPVRELFELMGKGRQSYGMLPSVRIASIDFGAVRTAVTAVTYALGQNQTVRPTLQLADACDYGADDVLDTVAQRTILPAIQTALYKAGISDARGFLLSLSGGGDDASGSVASPADQHILRGLLEFVVRSAAFGVIEHVVFAGAASPHVPMTTLLGDLLARQPLQLGGVPRVFSARVREVAGVAFDLLDVPVTATCDGLKSAVMTAVSPLVQTLTEIVDSLDCDMIQLSGGGTRLPFIGDAIVSALPFRPDRVIKLNEYPIGAWYPFRSAGNRPFDAKSLIVTGALLAEKVAAKQMPFALQLDGLASATASRSLLLEALRRQAIGHAGDRGAVVAPDAGGRLVLVAGNETTVSLRRSTRGDALRGGR